MSSDHASLKRTSFRNALLSLLGFAVVVVSFIYSGYKLRALEAMVEEKQNTLTTLQRNIDSAKVLSATIERKVADLESTQESLLDFLVSVEGGNNIRILDRSVNWDEVKTQLDRLHAGERKNAVVNAMLLAWKDIPFTLGGGNAGTGFDSPRFLQYVLKTVGIAVECRRGEQLSTALMNAFKKVDTPRPGDLVFFRGQVGSFGFLLAATGETDSDHVGIGTLQKSAPLQVVRMSSVNTPVFPLIGYYRVVYGDEKSDD